jgi:hypothetical protein
MIWQQICQQEKVNKNVYQKQVLTQRVNCWENNVLNPLYFGHLSNKFQIIARAEAWQIDSFCKSRAITQ